MNRSVNRTCWFVVLSVLASLAIAAPASAATTSKPYSLTITAGTPAGTPTIPTYDSAAGEVASGQTVGITATFKNETSTQQMGSVNLFWPSVFNVVSAQSTVGTATIDRATSGKQTCSYLGSSRGPCVQLRGLSLAPGKSVAVAMAVTTPACQGGNGFTWIAEAKQANDYSGSPGNDMTYDTANSQPDTMLDGACQLSWSTDPNNAQTNAVITSKSYDPSGAAPAVTVEDQSGNPVDTSTAPVTVALANNLFATLNPPGSLTQPADGATGTAAFAPTGADLSIGEAATGYELGATSGTLTGATSSSFNVTDQVLECTAGESSSACNVADGTTKQNGNSADVAATPNATGLLLESVNASNGNQLKCTGYTSADPNTYQFESTDLNGNPISGWSKVVTLTIRPLKKISGNANQILKNQQICFGAPEDFTTASGTLAPAGMLPDGTAGYIGLLPNCGGGVTGPCHNRKSDTTSTDTLSPNGFDLVLVADIPATFAGDPHMG